MEKNMFFRIILLITIMFIVKNNLYSQNTGGIPITDEQSGNIENIKTINAKYCAGKVFLHILTKGIIQSTTLYVERSIDGKNFEILGTISCNAVKANIDIAYYFIDAAPYQLTSYYRVVQYKKDEQASYSENICVYPENKSTTINDDSPILLFSKK